MQWMQTSQDVCITVGLQTINTNTSWEQKEDNRQYWMGYLPVT